jgi:hypothetical protein
VSEPVKVRKEIWRTGGHPRLLGLRSWPALVDQVGEAVSEGLPGALPELPSS